MRIILKPVQRTKRNAGLILKWENDVRRHPEEASNFLTKGTISRAKHWDWFKAKDFSHYYFVCISNGRKKKAGTISIDPDQKPSTYTMAILIARRWRNKGIGSKALKLACKKFKARDPGAKILAKVLSHNVPSLRCFMRAQFKKISEERFKKKRLSIFEYCP